ncbi:NAD(P)-dependent oxidoreductase [Streptomyces mobaraensis]|uniref:NAD(P)-dependent oxidoreductase n=1 Tax=Streptomyces mobaraensis TaxID=35621 RepID=A0A5N5W8B2_STRMB|nr:NAD(P)-binding domain-containing protein [Streptomyces mobaraensis]KAB7845063.1 NAD(P)-dependent oxidoreductase [Streptomyces mobaraensis]
MSSQPESKPSLNKRPVTVIGLGPMGKAMAHAFLKQGHAVTVWNRTASKADELVAAGAVLAPSVERALSVNELVVLSMTDYDAVYAVLEQAPHAVRGRVIVNLSSDTPERAREAAEWAARHGAVHLTGGVMSPPSGIGNPESSIFYSGHQAAFEAHRDTLAVLAGTDFRGTDPGLAQLYYQILMDLFWTGLISYVHAQTVADAYGIPAAEFLPYAQSTANQLPGFFSFYAPRLDAGDHTGDVDRVGMGVASLDHIVHTVRAAGVDSALPGAVLDAFRRAAAAGHENSSLTSLVEVFKKGAA